MPAKNAIRKTESPAELRLEWDNRTAQPDRFQFWFFVLFWLVWAPVTVFATTMIFRSGHPVFFSIWCVFGWAGTLGIPYSLLQRSWSEWISFSPAWLICGQSGPLAPRPKRIRTNVVDAIGIGHYGLHDDRESVVTLNVHYFTPRDRKARRLLGYWLHSSLKEQLFGELQQFAGKHQLSIAFQRY